MTSAEAHSAGSASRIWNLPNILTMLRIVMVPFFVWFLLLDAPGLSAQNGPWRWIAAVTFAVAIYTDKSLPDYLTSQGWLVTTVRPRFLPLTMKTRASGLTFLVPLYLRSPVKPLAGQMLVVATPAGDLLSATTPDGERASDVAR